MDPWVHGTMGACVHAFMAPWVHGAMRTCLLVDQFTGCVNVPGGYSCALSELKPLHVAVRAVRRTERGEAKEIHIERKAG